MVFFFSPKHKYIRITKDEHFKTEEHQLSLLPLKAEKSCSYDIDDVDSAWLKLCNGERSLGGSLVEHLILKFYRLLYLLK